MTGIPSRTARLARAPLLHCLLLGALCYALLGWERPVIRIDAGSLEIQEEQWLRATGERPDAAERQGLIDSAVRDELLLREARRRQLHRLPVVQQRLAQLGEFLQLSDGGDPATLGRQAERMGMLDQDPVIRRYLINTLELVLAAEAPVEPLDAADSAALQAYYSAHSDQYRTPRRLDITHLYFAGDAARRRAQAALAALHNDPTAAVDSDNFYGGRHWRGMTDTQLAARLGQAFVTALNGIEGIETGRWYGPLPSAYGLHLIRIDALHPARLKPLAQVADLIRATLQRQQQQAYIDAELARWRTRYRIELPGAASE